MKKTQSRRIQSMIEEYQQRLDETINQVNDMKQALIRRDQELDSWRDLLADMQVEISQLRASGPTLASTHIDRKPEPTNGFSWWDRVFGRKPVPAPPTISTIMQHELLHILAQEPHLRNPRL